MRIRTNLPTINKAGCAAIIKGLEERMSPRAKYYRKRVGIMKKSIAVMPDDTRKRLYELRVSKLSACWGHRRTEWTDDLRRRFAIGQLIAMPDRKYYAIIQNACANGIKPGQPFIHVCINRNKAHYVMALDESADIRIILQKHSCLAGKTIMKAFNKKRDTWTLYAKFGDRFQHVADVFGLDLAHFGEYVQDFVKPADARGPGRPRKPILHEFV